MTVGFRKFVSIFVFNQMFSSHLTIAKNAINQTLKYSAATQISKNLIIKEYGVPRKVVHIEETSVETPKSNEVCVKMLLAAVNPADINTVQGVYPVKRDLPFVPGAEGIGEIIAVGPMVEKLNAGDKVILNTNEGSSWRSYCLYNESQLYKVPDDVDLVSAAQLTVNPSTAYRMLKDFVNLKPGDAIIQNGANSAAGQNVIQLCKAWGIVSINVVRDRPDLENLKNYLTSLGADHVITEEELRTSPIAKSLKPKLALNCVGGKNALGVLRLLDDSGTMVTYGGMSREPLTVPTSSFIFKDLTMKGFWMTRWHDRNRNNNEQNKMFEELIQLIKKGSLKPPVHKFVALSNYKEALENTMSMNGFTGLKYFIDYRL